MKRLETGIRKMDRFYASFVVLVLQKVSLGNCSLNIAELPHQQSGIYNFHEVRGYRKNRRKYFRKINEMNGVAFQLHFSSLRTI